MHVTQKINIIANEMLGEAGLELYKALEELGWEDEQQTAAILQGLTFMVMSFTHEDIGEIYSKAHKEALPAMLRWREYHENEHKKNNN
jgi:hypothetical protein